MEMHRVFSGVGQKQGHMATNDSHKMSGDTPRGKVIKSSIHSSSLGMDRMGKSIPRNQVVKTGVK